MKRIIKRILIVVMCSTLFFASAFSTYFNTFTLEVQAASVAVPIAAEYGAALIEYLYGLFLSMGIIKAVDGWDLRASAVDAVLDRLSEYPELSGSTEFSVTVDGREARFTLEQAASYIKQVVKGTGAEAAKRELFTVLQGGGGKNGGDKDRQARIAGDLFTFMCSYIISNINTVREPFEDYVHRLGIIAFSSEEEELIEELTAELGIQNAPADYSVTDSSQVYFRGKLQDETQYMSFYDVETYLNFDLEKTWNGAISPSADSAELYFVGTNDVYCVKQIFNPNGLSVGLRVAALVPAVKHKITNGKDTVFSGQCYAVVVIEFSNFYDEGNVTNNFLNYDFDFYRDVQFCSPDIMNYNTGPFFTVDDDYNVSKYFKTISYPMETVLGWEYFGVQNCTTNQFFDIKPGTNNLNLSVLGGKDASLPLLIVNSIEELKDVCEGLLEHWDNSVFVNYSGNAENGIFSMPAYNQLSDDAAKALADALTNGGMSTDKVIDAAQAVDTLKAVEPSKLPELYPELYPEYQPNVNPAEYPDVYPDYDPVTNPNPAPSVQPDPDRVVVSVAVPNPEPEPDSKPDPIPNPGDDDWKTIDLTERFPFCIPFDLIHAFRLLAADAECPRWEIPFHVEFLGHVLEYTFVIDMALFEPLAKLFRTLETVGFCVGLILITRNIIRG